MAWSSAVEAASVVQLKNQQTHRLKLLHPTHNVMIPTEAAPKAETTPSFPIVRAMRSAPRYSHKGSVVGRMQIATEAKKTASTRLEAYLLSDLT